MWKEIAATTVATSEGLMALFIIATFLAPLVTFTPPLNMNGMSRAANQLARKTVRSEFKPVMMAHKVRSPRLLRPAAAKLIDT